MSSPEASLANLSPMPENGGGERTSVTSGRKCSALLTKSGPLGLSVRMLLESPLWWKEGYVLTWEAKPLCSRRVTNFTDTNLTSPTPSNASAKTLSISDIPSSRCLFRLRLLAHPTEETGSSSSRTMMLITPTSVQMTDPPEKMKERKQKNGYRNGTTYTSLETQVKYDPKVQGLIRTPSAMDARNWESAEYTGGGYFSTRDYAERETQGVASDTECGGSGTLPAQVHSGVADGDEPHRDGCVRSSTHTDSAGREEPQSSGRGTDSEEGGAEVHDRVERSRGYGNTPYSVREGLEGEDEPRSYEGGERMHLWGDPSGYDWAGLLPGARWADFPTVPPIHRGNDGIPIRMDNITIPFTKWRTESLKAYGNAIVPQVMYRIFQAIEFAEANSKTDLNS